MNKNQFLSLFSSYCWPIIRHFVKKNNRCKLCILSEKNTKISNGICEECIKFETLKDKQPKIESTPSEMLEEFNHLLKGMIGAEKYHALILLSGGKDSAYILERIRREFPTLRLVCLFVENGFSSPFVLQNVINLSKRFKTDLIISNDAIDEFHQLFSKAFVQLNGRGSSEVVDHADGTKIFQIGNKIAKQLNISYVIGGLSWSQVRQILKSETFIFREENRPTLISPLAVWRTNEEDIRGYVRKNKLLLKGSEDPIVSNNDLIVAMSAIDVLNSGYCSFELEFAQMIREGKAKRKVWLHNFELLEFATSRGLMTKDIKKTLSKFNLKLEDVLKISSVQNRGL